MESIFSAIRQAKTEVVTKPLSILQVGSFVGRFLSWKIQGKKSAPSNDQVLNRESWQAYSLRIKGVVYFDTAIVIAIKNPSHSVDATGVSGIGSRPRAVRTNPSRSLLTRFMNAARCVSSFTDTSSVFFLSFPLEMRALKRIPLSKNEEPGSHHEWRTRLRPSPRAPACGGSASPRSLALGSDRGIRR